MNRHTCSFALLISLAVLISGTLPHSIFAQQETSSDSDAEATELLRKAAETSFKASSYTIEMEQNIEQVHQTNNMTINQTNKNTVQFEDPYIHMKVETGGSANQRQIPSQSQTIIGQMNRSSGKVDLYAKSDQTGGNWQNMSKRSVVSFQKMFRRFKNPSKLPDRLQNIAFDGTETINGHSCRKITANQKKDQVESAAKDMLQDRVKKMLQNINFNIESSDVTYWIRTDEPLIEKVSINTDQNITMTMNIRGNQRKMEMDQSINMSMNYSDYNNTTVDEDMKKKYDELKAGDGSSEEEKSSGNNPEQGSSDSSGSF